MLIVKDEKTNKIKRLYTGREIIIAMGKKYQQLHDVYKPFYDTYFELFDHETKDYIPIDKMPLFANENDFYECLADGNKDIYRIERLNSKKFKDKKGNIIKVNNINELKKYKNKLLKPIHQFILYGLSIAMGIVLGKFIILLMKTYLG